MTTINPSSSLAPKNSQKISFPLGFSTICGLVLWTCRGTLRQTRVTFLVFTALSLSALSSLCVYLDTAKSEQSSLTTTITRTFEVLVLFSDQLRFFQIQRETLSVTDSVDNPSSNPAHNADCLGLKILSCGQEIICTCIICLKNGAKKAGSGLFLPG